MSNLSILAVPAKFRAVPIIETGVRMVDLDELYQASFEAEVAWLDGIRRLWGRQAFKARYDERGVSTTHLRQLYEQFQAAEAVYMEATAVVEGPLQRSKHQPTENQTPEPRELSDAA